MDGRRMAGAVAGGLVAGAVLSAMMMLGERRGGKPSELVALERKAANRFGVRTPRADRLPDAREQAVVQGGHLLLSAAAGVAYAAATPEDAGVVPSGLAFGVAFYAAMHWITGPLLGVKPPEWRADRGTLGMHTINHLGFGLVTALGAKLASRTRAA